MKPTLGFSDYSTLRRLINNSTTEKYEKETTSLRNELDNSIVVDDNFLSNEIVRLNSKVEIQDLKTGQISVFKIVLPSEANLKEKKVSVVAPLGIALIGFKEGYIFNWNMPGGLKRIRINRVENEEPGLAT